MVSPQGDVHLSVISAIKEYLSRYNYTDTLECFERESSHRNAVSVESLLAYIDSGNKELFFANWKPQIIHSIESKATEVLLTIFFIMYSSNPLFCNPVKPLDTESLKDFLKENSEFISQHPELIAYFALPYINNPSEHPKFYHLFNQNWVNSLKQKAVSHIRPMTEGLTVLETLFGPVIPSPKQGRVLSRIPSSPRFHPEMTFAPLEMVNCQISLNFALICSDLNNLPDELQICALLQALRWRLTQTDNETSSLVLGSYIKNNLLCTYKPHDLLLERLLRFSRKVKEFTVKLMNVISYKKIGREYLITKEGLVELIAEILFKERNKTTLRQSCLSLFQKLSLNKAAQVQMIQADMIKWILRVLKNDLDGVDEEMIEFCTGIAMNLSIRSAAKSKFEEVEFEMMHAIMRYLGHNNLNIVRYIHCLLYALLSYERFRDSAKRLGMNKLLRSLKDSSDEEMQKQIELILDQMDAESDNNTSFMTEIENEDSIVIIDGDLDDVIKDPKILKGNELLKYKYEAKSTEITEKPSQDIFLSRDKIPRTPYSYS